MRDTAIVQLVHGLRHGDAVEGLRHGDAVESFYNGDAGDREAALRPLTGNDECLLAECPERLTPAACATALLAAATQRIGRLAPVDPEMAARLTLGDRERLLLALCSMTFGATLDLVARCPACGGLADVEVPVDDILGATLRPANSGAITGALELWPEDADGRWHIQFRLPTGRDQEIAAATADRRAAVAALTAACVLSCTSADGGAQPAEVAASRFGNALGAAFEQHDPAVEAMTAIDCAECGAASPALLDAFAILHAGLARGERVLGETWLMARNYHWSETDILALPIARRRRYLEIAAARAGL